MDSKGLQEIIIVTKTMKVLYVEDNQDVREQTLKMLKVFFNNIEIAENGEEALEIFNSSIIPFDLIITDIEMPILDGITMICSIREKNKNIPIIIFSAHDNTEYFLDAIHAGIDEYILKPFNINKVSDTLMNVLEKRKLNSQKSFLVPLENDYIWDKEKLLLYKNEEEVKLTKNEIRLFKLFIDSKATLKTYDEIDSYIFMDFTAGNKRVRNLISRLKVKLGYELFESIYSHGYKLKYKNNA